MSTLYYHEKRDRAKWAVVAITLLLIIAVIVTGVLSDWFTNFNKYCVFGHDYGEIGICTRCGKVKPIENEPEQQPQFNAVAYASENLLAESAPINKKTPSSITEYENGFPDGNAKYPLTYDANLNKLFRINGNEPKKETILASGETKLVFGVSENPEDSYHSYSVYYRRQGTTRWMPFRIQVDSPRTVNNTSGYFGVYDVFLMKDDILSDKNYTLFTYSDWFTVYFGVGEELPSAPIKTGYTFTGWYTDEACTQLYTEDIVVGDITLYAGFRANTYTINFMANNGNGTMTEMQCTYGVEYTLPTCTLERLGYKFLGWSIQNDDRIDLTDKQTFSNLSDVDNAVIELYAVWELNEVTVSFEWDDNVLEQSCIVGQAVELPEEPSKTGYVFVGWQYDDGTMYDGQAITEDTTLTAKFEIIQCVVTFIVDGEVYCVYVCDYGTKLSEALRKSNVNTALYETEDEYSRNF